MTILRVFDFETTGFEPPVAEVCEVGICDLHLEDRSFADPVSWLCGVKEMPPEVRAVHHISKAECDPFEPFNPDRLSAAMPAKTPDAFVAHNAKFELKFYTPPGPVICTYKCALRAWPDAPSHSNGALRYWLEDQGKIAPDAALTQPAHRAAPDAYVTANILLALFDTGITGKTMVQWTREPPHMPRCTIGEWRGKSWSEVDAGFLGWMIRNATMEEDLKFNARREIERRQKGE